MAEDQDGTQQDKTAKATTKSMKDLGGTAKEATEALENFVKKITKFATNAEDAGDRLVEAGKRVAKEGAKEDISRFRGSKEIASRLTRGSINELAKALAGQSNGLSPFKNLASSAIEISAKQLAEASVNSGAALSAVANGLLKVGGIFGVAANAVVMLGDAAYQGGMMLMENYQQMIESGQSFSGSMLEMANTAWQTGMSISQLTDVVTRFSPVMATVGVRQFAQFSKSVRDASFEMGQYGYSIQDMNRFLGEYVESLRLQGREIDLTSDKQKNYARQTLETIFRAQQATGKQREEILRDAAAAQRTVEYRARMRLDPTMTTDQQAGINRLLTFFAAQPGEAGAFSRGAAQLVGQGNQIQFAEMTKLLLETGLSDVAEDLARVTAQTKADPENAEIIGNAFIKRLQQQYLPQHYDMLLNLSRAGDANATRFLEMFMDARALTEEQLAKRQGLDGLTKLFLNIRNAFTDFTGKLASTLFANEEFKKLADSISNIFNSFLNPESIERYMKPILGFVRFVSENMSAFLNWFVTKLEWFVESLQSRGFSETMADIFSGLVDKIVAGAEWLIDLFIAKIKAEFWWPFKNDMKEGQTGTRGGLGSTSARGGGKPTETTVTGSMRGQNNPVVPAVTPTEPVAPTPDQLKTQPPAPAVPSPLVPTKRRDPEPEPGDETVKPEPAKPAPAPIAPAPPVPTNKGRGGATSPAPAVRSGPQRRSDLEEDTTVVPAKAPMGPSVLISPAIDAYSYSKDPEKYEKDKTMWAERYGRTADRLDRFLYNLFPDFVQKFLTPPREETTPSLYDQQSRVKQLEESIAANRGAIENFDKMSRIVAPGSTMENNYAEQRDQLIKQNEAMIKILNDARQILKNIESQNSKGI